jgi:hypothetical protein
LGSGHEGQNLLVALLHLFLKELNHVRLLSDSVFVALNEFVDFGARFGGLWTLLGGGGVAV